MSTGSIARDLAAKGVYLFETLAGKMEELPPYQKHPKQIEVGMYGGYRIAVRSIFPFKYPKLIKRN